MGVGLQTFGSKVARLVVDLVLGMYLQVKVGAKYNAARHRLLCELTAGNGPSVARRQVRGAPEVSRTQTATLFADRLLM
jgi:hypothetical protein